MTINLNKGFTLIELLTVISIIGIMSSIVISSLGSAKGKGANATVKSTMAQLRSEALIFFDTGETYNGLCTSTRFKQIVDAAHAASGSTAAGGVVTVGTTAQVGVPPNATTNCRADATSWSVSAPLKVPETSGGSCTAGTPCNYYCVDYRGIIGSKINISSNSSLYVCPAT